MAEFKKIEFDISGIDPGLGDSYSRALPYFCQCGNKLLDDLIGESRDVSCQCGKKYTVIDSRDKN